MIFAVVGPSGAGKDTLIAGAAAARPDLHVVRRVITRPTEAGGEDFEGVTPSAFAVRKAAGEFAVDWSAHGLRYGIPHSQVDRPGDLVFNCSRAALTAAQAAFCDLRVILVTAPSATLAERLAARGREDIADIRARLARADFQLPNGIQATTIINDSTAEQGIERLLAALQPVRA